MTTKHTKLHCLVKATKDAKEHDLGTFPMLDNPEIAFSKIVPTFSFDYYGLSEELVNRQIMSDEIEASLACETIEYSLNEGGDWAGSFQTESGVTISFVIEPDAVRSEDGYTFTRQDDGRYTDGDMTWSNFTEFRETCEVEWIPVALP